MNWENLIKTKIPTEYFLRYALVSFLIVCWVWQRERKKIYYSLRSEKKQIFKTITKSICLFITFHFVLKLFLSQLIPSLSIKSKKIEMLVEIINNRNHRDSYLTFKLIFFGLCVLAPLIEECIFRFFIFNLFGKKNPFSYFFSFFSFVLAHYHWGENLLVLFFQYSVASLAFIYVYRKSKWNLLTPILLHFLINLLFIGITFFNPTCFLI